MTDKQAIDVKGTTISTLAFRVRTGTLRELTRFLEKKFGRRAAFFEGEPVVIDLQEVGEIDDFPGFIVVLRRLGLVPVAVRNASESMAEAAASMQLAVLESDSPAGAQDVAESPALSALVPENVCPSAASSIGSGSRVSSVSKTVGLQTPKPSEGLLPVSSARVIRRPLRSGQQVYAQGRDLIALDLVSFGAEVIADGNVHVYAPLRGRALAGVKGDRNARIYTLSMQAELVAIAGVYRTFEEPIPLSLQNRPVQIFLNDADKIIIEPIGHQ